MTTYHATQEHITRPVQSTELIAAYALIDSALKTSNNAFFVKYFDRSLSQFQLRDYHSLACQLSTQINLSLDTTRQRDINYFVSLGASYSNFKACHFNISKIEFSEAKKCVVINKEFTNRVISDEETSSLLYDELRTSMTLYDYANIALKYKVSIASILKERVRF